MARCEHTRCHHIVGFGRVDSRQYVLCLSFKIRRHHAKLFLLIKGGEAMAGANLVISEDRFWVRWVSGASYLAQWLFLLEDLVQAIRAILHFFEKFTMTVHYRSSLTTKVIRGSQKWRQIFRSSVIPVGKWVVKRQGGRQLEHYVLTSTRHAGQGSKVQLNLVRWS